MQVPDHEYQRQCQRMGCKNLIDPKRRTAKFCSDACRQADGREMRRLRPPILCDHCKKLLKKGTYAAIKTTTRKTSDSL